MNEPKTEKEIVIDFLIKANEILDKSYSELIEKYPYLDDKKKNGP